MQGEHSKSEPSFSDCYEQVPCAATSRIQLGGIVRLGCHCDRARCFGAALTNMASHLELQTPATVLGKRGVVWDLLIEAQACKPAPRQSAQSRRSPNQPRRC